MPLLLYDVPIVLLAGAGEEGEHDDTVQKPEEHAAEKERTAEGPTQASLKVSCSHNFSSCLFASNGRLP